MGARGDLLLENFQQVSLHILENEVQLALSAEGLAQVNDVLVAEHPDRAEWKRGKERGSIEE